MPGEAAKILLAQPMLVPQLNRVRPTFRQFAEERVKVGNEIPAVLVIGRMEARELEHQHAHLVADVFTRLEERGREQIGI